MPNARRPAVNLTDLKVKALRPDLAGEYVQGDTQVPGFGVRVRPSGAATYIIAKRMPGETRPVRVTLGRVGEISLHDAREKAREKASELRQGVDVNAEKRKAAAQRKAARAAVVQSRAETGYAPDTFGALAARYINRECCRLARGDEIAALIRRELLPQLGKRPLSELRRRDLGDVVDAIVDRGHPAAAHKLREVGKRITSWGEDEELIERDPFLGGKNPIRRVDRTRTLAPAEINALWHAWQTMGPLLGGFMQFALATAQRRGEVATMEWAELDLDQRLWAIPAAKAKNRRVHLVPLSTLACEILEAVPQLDDRYVWSTRAGTRISGFSKAKAYAADLAGVEGWRLHDLRRTATTEMAGLGIDRRVISKLLNHTPRGVIGVTAIYDRFEYLDERREALERWAGRLGAIAARRAAAEPARPSQTQNLPVVQGEPLGGSN